MERNEDKGPVDMFLRWAEGYYGAYKNNAIATVRRFLESLVAYAGSDADAVAYLRKIRDAVTDFHAVKSGAPGVSDIKRAAKEAQLGGSIQRHIISSKCPKCKNWASWPVGVKSRCPFCKEERVIDTATANAIVTAQR